MKYKVYLDKLWRSDWVSDITKARDAYASKNEDDLKNKVDLEIEDDLKN